MTKTIKEYNDYVFEVSASTLSKNFFSRNDFLSYQSHVQNKQYLCFQLKTSSKNKVIFECVFCHKDGETIFFSPITGAFSDIFQGVGLSPCMMKECFTEIEGYLVSVYGEIKLSITLPPLYFSNSSGVINCLINLGWVIEQTDVNYHLEIFDDFELRNSISSSKRKCLNKLIKNDYEFFELDINLSNVKDVYNVIAINRTALGYPVTMPEVSIIDLSSQFQNDVKLFCVKKDGLIVASAICLKINLDTLYVFYWAELPEDRVESPILKLADGISDYCEKNKIKFLDVGISTEDSKPNYGLMNFKKQLGCVESLKFTLIKETLINAS
tara:strand:+ start:11192 stop:12169 length:978 start_codon:yes stop_codon:yes gene_type:complete